jgi:hypothetical protein
MILTESSSDGVRFLSIAGTSALAAAGRQSSEFDAAFIAFHCRLG